MESLTNKSSRWPRKTTAAGMIPLLLAQVSIALFCVPQSLTAGTEIRREITWEELSAFLESETKVTVVLTEGGAVRSEGGTALSDSIHLHHIIMATNSKRYPWGSEASIAKDSVKEIHLENMRDYARVGGAVLGGAGAFGLAWLYFQRTGRESNLALATVLGAPVGGAVLGYWLGKREDLETTIITIVD